MVDFEDDFFTSMVQDDSRAGSRRTSSRSQPQDNDFVDAFLINVEVAPPQRRPRRRASIGAPEAMVQPPQPAHTKSGTSSRTISSDRPSESVRSGSRRPGAVVASSRSLDGQLETVPGTRTRITDRSVASSASMGIERARRSGRRASLAAGPPPPSRNSTSVRKKQQLEDEVDYGYGDGSSPVDIGYGDTTSSPGPPMEQPVKSRRQRRCSIADVVMSSGPVTSSSSSSGGGGTDYGYGDAPPDTAHASPVPVPAARGLARQNTGNSQRLGAHSGNSNTMTNMAIPMTASEEPKKSGRRGSIAMLSGMGRNKPKVDVPEAAAAIKKPGADRDRHRQGTLMDRVGASDRGGSRSGVASSYSDRILSK